MFNLNCVSFLNYEEGVYFIVDSEYEYLLFICICKVFGIYISSDYESPCSYYIRKESGMLRASGKLRSNTSLEIYCNCKHGKKGLVITPSKFVETFKDSKTIIKFFEPKII